MFVLYPNSTSMDEDDSVLNSIFAKITGVQGRSRSSSDASARQIAREKRRSIYKAMSRPPPASVSQALTLLTKSVVGLSFPTSVQRFIHPLRRLVVYPIGDMNRFSVPRPFLHMDAGSLDPFDYGLPNL
jgi:serine/arginine repetitive matrix protein 2